MEQVTKRKLLAEIKRQKGFDVNDTTFMLCENAAISIIKDMKHRKKNILQTGWPETVFSSGFKAKLTSEAIKCINNQKGNTQEANLVYLVALVMIVAIIFVLVRENVPALSKIEYVIKQFPVGPWGL